MTYESRLESQSIAAEAVQYMDYCFLLLIKEISKRDDLHERSMTLIVFLFSAFSSGIGVLGVI